MYRNAIILAAGKSMRFAPFTYEKPKGLFCVRGKVLIERQIEQLQEAGIYDIYIVVGYMKEKFFYLEQKYGVHLIINNEFGKKGNLYSLYQAKEYLNNTYVCCADQYFINNPFQIGNEDNVSFRYIAYQTGKYREFGISKSDANIITEIRYGGNDSYAMVGSAYLNERFSKVFKKLLENEINDFGIDALFWEEFYAIHMKELSLFALKVEKDDVLEFDSIDDLRRFDSDFLANVDSEIVSNICFVLQCDPNEIKNIDIINAGLTNVSFSFTCKDYKYVYRHPGGTADKLVDRNTEFYAQTIAKDKHIDDSFIYMDVSGWKISYFVENAKNCDFVENKEQLDIAFQYLHELHQSKVVDGIKVFDNVEEGKKLMKIASSTKGNLEKEFEDVIHKVDVLYSYIKQDSKRLNKELVLCHNDVYAPNYLYDKNNKIYLIDWEYAGLNYEANDLGCILCRYDWKDAEVNEYLQVYLNHKPTKEEYRYYIAFTAISAFYWFCWGLYKGSVGDDDSFFFLPSYRNLVRYLDVSLERYRENEK